MTSNTEPISGERISDIRRLRLAAVINWPDRGRWLWRDLSEEQHEADLIFASPNHDAFIGGRDRLPPYLRELYHLARRRPPWGRYDVVFAWELRAALATALLLGRRGTGRPRFVAIAPILKGPVLRVMPLVRAALARADRIVCFSSAECDAYARLLRLPRERFLFLPLPGMEDEPFAETDTGFILALGRSNRDYPTLLEAVRGSDLPVTIVAGSLAWTKGLDVPPNVTLRCNLGHHETRALVAEATLHVIPLNAADYSSGQTVLLRAMSCGKAVVISHIPGVRDYVRDGETGVLVPPGDAPALGAALRRLWDNPAERRRLGENAARAVREEFSFARFVRDLLALAEELMEKSSERQGGD